VSKHIIDLDKIKSGSLKLESVRLGFGRGLLAAAEKKPEVVALSADLTESIGMNLFAEKYPERFVQVGIAEQNLVTVASGLAAMGKRPFAGSYAVFSPGRNWEQIRTTICINDQPVVIVGSHAGLSVGADGATHQSLEDIALMRVLPNMTVIAPGDSLQAEKATLDLALKHNSPAYLRLARNSTPIFTSESTEFEIGPAYVYAVGGDLTLISTGTMTAKALLVAEKLFKRGIDIEVVHAPTIKPLDNSTILKSVKKTGCVVTLEDAQIAGGLGSTIAELLAENMPVPLKRIGVSDEFGQSGEAEELYEKYGLSVEKMALTISDFWGSIKT
jgi:transketolase